MSMIVSEFGSGSPSFIDEACFPQYRKSMTMQKSLLNISEALGRFGHWVWISAFVRGVV